MSTSPMTLEAVAIEARDSATSLCRCLGPERHRSSARHPLWPPVSAGSGRGVTTAVMESEGEIPIREHQPAHESLVASSPQRARYRRSTRVAMTRSVAPSASLSQSDSFRSSSSCPALRGGFRAWSAGVQLPSGHSRRATSSGAARRRESMRHERDSNDGDTGR